MSGNDLLSKASNFLPIRRASTFLNGESQSSTKEKNQSERVSVSFEAADNGKTPYNNLSKEELISIYIKMRRKFMMIEKELKESRNRENEGRELLENIKSNLQDEIRRREEAEEHIKILKISLDSIDAAKGSKNSTDGESLSEKLKISEKERAEIERNCNEKIRKIQNETDEMKKEAAKVSADHSKTVKSIGEKYEEEILKLKIQIDLMEKRLEPIGKLAEEKNDALSAVEDLKNQLVLSKREMEAFKSKAAAALNEAENLKSVVIRLKEVKERANNENAGNVAQLAKERNERLECLERMKDLGEKFEEKCKNELILNERVLDLKCQIEKKIEMIETSEKAHAERVKSLEDEAIERAKRESEIAESKLEEAKAEALKKSLMARQLLTEKDAKIIQLTSKIVDLEMKVENGIHSEPTQPIPLKIRMQNAEDGNKNYKEQSELSNEGHGSSSFQDIETQAPVNLQYIKNVIVQYMSFGAGTRERETLVPVVAKLLHFTEQDREKVMQGLEWEWWGGLQEAKPASKIRLLGS